MLALLVESEANDPLLLALLDRLPSLRAPTAVRALDPSIPSRIPSRFDQLAALAGLQVGDEEVELLLTPHQGWNEASERAAARGASRKGRRPP